ncbi:phage tail protein I [Variovorax sp. CY25R-8]|uniref:phage tail protein I n=1 Tax=Variovorax sp. CY25R-8 TaxID=2855501 RepID=UPI0021BB401A|nr:phage tail protein I [Variovorax sp. CY25R-8]MCT8178132.1 phage tail protein I [Variovorax sp. CY25R-8]
MTGTVTLLPSNASALERAVAAADARISTTPTPLRDVWNPITCPANLLPWLAFAYAVDEWDETWTTETKRQVISQALEVKRTKGTPGGVQSALAAVGLPARVQEWFQQAPFGAPYTFRVHVEAEQVGFSAAQIAQLRRVVHQYKNTRSHLDGVDITVRTTGGPRPASVALAGVEARVSDGTPTYEDGLSALDFLVDGAVNGYATTADAADQMQTILREMPAKLTIPSDL